MTDQPMSSLTPVGDWLRSRYPPDTVATHWLGKGDDPGCRAGGHSSCTYHSGWSEALRSFAAEMDDLGHTSLADLAREKADAPASAAIAPPPNDVTQLV
jgi:hypothetical protein